MRSATLQKMSLVLLCCLPALMGESCGQNTISWGVNSTDSQYDAGGTACIRVADEDGNLLEGISVTVTNPELQYSYIKMTNRDGIASFPNLTLGAIYDLTVTDPEGTHAPPIVWSGRAEELTDGQYPCTTFIFRSER